MKQSEIRSNNKLIAEFMGLLPIESIQHKGYYQLDKHRGKIWYRNRDDVYEKCKYHSSWDWLMLVVEKVEELGYCVETGFGLCRIKFDEDRTWTNEGSKLASTYYRIVEFIKWYNKQK